MKILMLGDVTSPAAARYLCGALPAARRRLGADLVTVNAENAGFIIGATPDTATSLLAAGADVLTGGNHTLQNYDMLAAIDGMPRVLRPLNYPAAAPGDGVVTVTVGGVRVLVMSLLGRVHMEPPLSSPFEAAAHALDRARGRYDVAIVDFHAEATGEKLAMAHYLDGRVAVVAGTHTHVPTADLTLLPRGTAYVSDLGMCGAVGSILGMDAEDVVTRYLTGIHHKLHAAEGRMRADGVLFTVDVATGTCTAAERCTV